MIFAFGGNALNRDLALCGAAHLRAPGCFGGGDLGWFVVLGLPAWFIVMAATGYSSSAHHPGGANTPNPNGNVDLVAAARLVVAYLVVLPRHAVQGARSRISYVRELVLPGLPSSTIAMLHIVNNLAMPGCRSWASRAIPPSPACRMR